ncbi:putative internal protein A [uncultured Mediterranean phage uvMED]|nr:putative internal protein A [uncultured Mediterranean phage uvMED]
MSALGNIAAAQSAKRIAKYNASVTRMERDFLDAKREVNIKFYNNVTKPLLLKNQEKAKANLFVSSLRTGFEVREGTTPYDVMLENNVNQAFNVLIADYNQEMDANDQLNQSLMLEAKAAGQEFAGRMTARGQYFAAAGSLLSDANKLGFV